MHALFSLKHTHTLVLVATYRVVHTFTAQRDGDLDLSIGEMVILIEAPAGGEWWRGKAHEIEGWFPKTCVEYVDIEAEEKRKKEGKQE